MECNLYTCFILLISYSYYQKFIEIIEIIDIKNEGKIIKGKQRKIFY